MAVFLLALLPRLWGLGRQPFWFDEITTLQRSSLPLRALIRNSFANDHTPFYFLLVAPFSHSNDPQFWMRLPSAIFGALGVVLVYIIAARVAGRNAGTAAALIVALSPTEIAYAQEARGYTLVSLLILIALHGLIGLVLSQERSALPWRNPDAPKSDWLQFLAGSTCAFCTLGDSLPWLLVADLTATMLIWRSRNRAAMARNFLLANAITLAICLPLYGIMLHLEARSVGTGLAFIPPLTAPLIWYNIEAIYLQRICDFVSAHFIAVPTPGAVIWLIGAGLLAACVAGLWHLRKIPLVMMTLLLAILTLPILCVIVSIWKPMLMTRYLLWSGPPFAILAGIGIEAARRRSRFLTETVTFSAVASLLLLNLQPFYSVETVPRWDSAAQILARQSNPGDVFYLFEPISGPTLRFYLPQNLQARLITDWSGNLQHAIQARAQGRRIWAIYGDAAQRRNWISMTDFRASLAPLGKPASLQEAGTRIYIWRFDPPKTKAKSASSAF